MRFVQVTNTTRNTMIGDRIMIADTSLRRMVGLLGKSGLAAGEGLWIRPSSGVHTVGMRFMIDVIGLDKNYKVLKLWSQLRPYRVTSISAKLRSTIELPAGRIAECQVELGDAFRFGPNQI